MLRAYLSGARGAARRWPLVVALWAISAVFGLAFAATSGLWLTDALGGSLATRTLSRSIDANVLVDLWYHHREGLHVVLVVAGVLAAFNAVLWWWLHGVLIRSVQQDAGAAESAIWTEGLALAPLMARLFAIALAVIAAYTAGIGGATYALLRWTHAAPGAYVWYQIGGVAVVLWAIGAVFLVAVHDHARLRAARAAVGAVSAYRWALGFVLRGGERAFLLACALQLTGLAMWAVFQAIGGILPTSVELGFTASLVWGEIFLVFRFWLRVWFFAAENDLQS